MNKTAKESSPRVLIISSLSLSTGPAFIAGQYYEALRRSGLNVDLLLKYSEPGRKDILYVFGKRKKNNFYLKVFNALKRRILKNHNQKPGYGFDYRKENHPPVKTKTILDKINYKYDLVFVVFWQEMLSFETIDKIYEKLHCQFQFSSVDFSQMSGGCHFTNGCIRYKTGCGCCPAYGSDDEHDFTAWNVAYREKIYAKVKPIVYGNNYMQEFYKQSYLLKNARIETNSIIIDTDIFKPLIENSNRRKFGIPTKKVIIFFASQNLTDERKGINYIIEALNLLYKKDSGIAENIYVITAGLHHEKICNLIPFENKGLGYVRMNELPSLFSISRMFVCSSVNDAGPMMVAQSLSCGTPVVGFDMGAIKDLVKGKGTGICVPLKNTEALSDGIERIVRMQDDEYDIMTKRCRDVALQYCSFEAQAKQIINTYYKYCD